MPQVSARGKIVEAGFRVLYAKGFNGCSIQDITDDAGVPKGSFYNHFKSKEALALEVIDLYAGYARLDMLQDTSKPPLARLRAHFDFMTQVHAGNGGRLGCLAGNFTSELAETSPMLRAELALRFAGWNEAVSNVIRDAQTAGEVSATLDADRLGRFIVASWEGALLSMKLNRSMQSVEDFFALVFPLLGTSAAAKTIARKARAG